MWLDLPLHFTLWVLWEFNDSSIYVVKCLKLITTTTMWNSVWKLRRSQYIYIGNTRHLYEKMNPSLTVGGGGVFCTVMSAWLIAYNDINDNDIIVYYLVAWWWPDCAMVCSVAMPSLHCASSSVSAIWELLSLICPLSWLLSYN